MSSTDVERFLSIRTFENLAEYLGISPKELGFFAHSKKDFYSVWYIYKKNGTGRRKIASPCSKLKRIQRTLHDVLIQIYEPPDCVHGFLSERSIVTNACQHIGTPGIAKIDLKDFFPSITAGRIRGLFLSKPFCFPAKVANALTNLVCADGSLPQGAPTSPVLSNMICYSLDRSLLNFARKNKLRYTRYADDLVFSSHAKRSLYKVVRYAPDKTSPEITKHIASIIKKNGFEVNEQKIGIFGKGTRQIVTGIVVNKKCNFRRSDYRFLRNTFYYWKKKGKYEAAQRYFQAKGKWQIIVEKSNNDKNYIEGYFQFHLQGMLHYFSMIEKGSGRVSAPLCKLWDHFHDLTGEPVPEMSFERSVLMSDSYIRYHCIGEDKEQEYGCKGTAFILKGIGIVSALHCFSPITVSGITIDKSYILLDTNDKTIELCSDSISAKSYADDWVLFSTIPKELSGLPGLIAAPKRVLPQKGQRVTAYGYAEGDKVIRRIDAKVLEVLNNVVIVDRAFIKGMSGGPVLNSRGEVIGLITKGSGEGSYNYDGQFVLLNAIPQVEKKIENTIITD